MLYILPLAFCVDRNCESMRQELVSYADEFEIKAEALGYFTLGDYQKLIAGKYALESALKLQSRLFLMADGSGYCSECQADVRIERYVYTVLEKGSLETVRIRQTVYEEEIQRILEENGRYELRRGDRVMVYR